MRRRGFGLVLGLVLVVLALLSVALTAQGTLSSGIADQVERDVRAEEADVLAESALDEALVHIALEANGGADGRSRGKIFQMFRGAQNPAWDPQAGFPVPLDVRDLPGFAKLLAKRPLHRSPAPELTAAVRFQRFFDSDGLREHDERFGTLELSATIAYGGAAARRRAVRWVEFRVVHLGLPAPFDRTMLHITDPRTFVNANAFVGGVPVPWANDLLVRAADGINSEPGKIKTELDKTRELKDEIDKVAGLPRAGAFRQYSAALGRVIEALESALKDMQTILTESQADVNAVLTRNLSGPPLRLFGWPFVMYTFATPGSADRNPAQLKLDDINLPAIARTQVKLVNAAEQQADSAKNAYTQALIAKDPNIDEPGLAHAAAALARVQAYRQLLVEYKAFQSSHFEQGGDDKMPVWLGYRKALAEDEFSPFAAQVPTAGRVTLRAAKAQFRIGDATDPAGLELELEKLLERYGPAFQGVVYVDNAAGAELVLDGSPGARELWGRFAGRLTLAVAGDCTLKNVKRREPDRDLLTVLCFGQLTLGGTVEASVVVHRGLKRLPPPLSAVQLKGCLVMDDRPFAATEPPDAVLAGITLTRDDLVPSWDPKTGNLPEYETVLFGVAPAYATSLRRVK